MEPEYLTVSQLTRYLKRKFDFDPYLQQVYVTGEISNFRLRPNAHQYFSIKDDHAKLNVIMFKRQFEQLKFVPQEGMKVQAVGRLSLYEASGTYQLYLEQLSPDGVGALFEAYEQLKKKLAAEGAFNLHQRKLPKYPQRLAVITSESGAVIRDIMTTAHRRDPKVQLVLFPALVQGEAATADLVARLKQVYTAKPAFDAIIIGRGGGSIEDLWPFNEEALARTLLQSPIPVVSSVGHETDTTIADYIADVRAATPTAAAELVTPVYQEVKQHVQDLNLQLLLNFKHQLALKKQRLQRSQESYLMRHPDALYQGYSQHQDELRLRLLHATQILVGQQHQRFSQTQAALQRYPWAQQFKTLAAGLEQWQHRLAQITFHQVAASQQHLQGIAQQLDQLSPLQTLARGYTVLEDKNGKALTSAQQLSLHNPVKLTLRDGQAQATITSITLDKEQKNG